MTPTVAEALIAGWTETPSTTYLLTDPRQGLYFVSCLGYIKIGIAKDVRVRLRDIRAMVPTDVVELGWVPIADYAACWRCEQALHQQFSATRRKGGEWFTDLPALRTFIATYARSWPLATKQARL